MDSTVLFPSVEVGFPLMYGALGQVSQISLISAFHLHNGIEVSSVPD